MYTSPYRQVLWNNRMGIILNSKNALGNDFTCYYAHRKWLLLYEKWPSLSLRPANLGKPCRRTHFLLGEMDALCRVSAIVQRETREFLTPCFLFYTLSLTGKLIFCKRWEYASQEQFFSFKDRHLFYKENTIFMI